MLTVSTACASGATALGLARRPPARRPRRRSWWPAASTPSAASSCVASTRFARSRGSGCGRSTGAGAACSWARAPALVLHDAGGRRPGARGSAACSATPARATAPTSRPPIRDGRGLRIGGPRRLAAGRRRRRRHRVRERARHGHAAERPDRDGRPQARARGRGPGGPDQLDQGRARATRWARPATLEAIMCLLAARDGMIPPTLGSRGARSRVRPRLRAASAAAGPPAGEPEHLAGLRRLQCGARPRRCGVHAGVRDRRGRAGDRLGRGAGRAARRCRAAAAGRAVIAAPAAAARRRALPPRDAGVSARGGRRARHRCATAGSVPDDDAGERARRSSTSPRAPTGPPTARSSRSPAQAAGTLHFPYTAPSAVPAEVAIEFGLTGPYVILIGGAHRDHGGARRTPGGCCRRGTCERALVLAVETFARVRRPVRPRRAGSLGRPLVEAAACALLRCPGRLHRGGRRPGAALGGVSAAPRRRDLACAPLIALALARESGDDPLHA